MGKANYGRFNRGQHVWHENQMGWVGGVITRPEKWGPSICALKRDDLKGSIILYNLAYIHTDDEYASLCLTQ